MKRILSLDGGGIRGVFTLQVLARVEELFRQDLGRADLVLSDVFDLIAGASTGAIIAAFLAWGKSVAQVEKMYLDFGPTMFSPQRWYRRWKSKYRAESIADFFRGHFCESDGTPALMGTALLRTKLLVLMRNATTGSPWPVSNHPDAYYNDRSRENCNLNVPLWQLLRASTAAPTFFPPEQIEFGRRRFLFVDGAVTPFNNPALIALLMATLPQYRICWPTGRDALHVISIGTGSERTHLPDKLAGQVNFMDQLKFVIPALLDAASVQQDMLCRVLGDCVFGEPLDKEVGAVDTPSLLGAHEQKFTYVRYDQVMDRGPLDLSLDHAANMPIFQRLGRAYAAANVHSEHLYPRSAANQPK
jgi:patatin-like phospholipase/acyl hydrolase